MTIDELYQFVQFIARKSQSGSNPSPTQFNLAVQGAYREWVMQRYGNTSEYQPGRPVPRVAYEVTQKITDDLGYLKESRQFLATAGRVLIPDGSTVADTSGAIAPHYLHLSSLRRKSIKDSDGVFEAQERGVNIIRDNEISEIINSPIVKPTDRYPAAALYSDHIQIYPKTTQYVVLTYLRQPTMPVWGFISNSTTTNRPVYDPPSPTSATVDLESPLQTHNEIAIKTLRFLGISIRDGQLAQYTTAMNQEKI